MLACLNRLERHHNARYITQQMTTIHNFSRRLLEKLDCSCIATNEPRGSLEELVMCLPIFAFEIG